MKITIIIFFALCFLPFTYCQTKSSQKVIESYISTKERNADFVDKVIKTALEDTTNEDMLILLNEAIKTAEEIKYDAGLAESYRIVGMINIYKGNFDAAAENLYKSIDLFKQIKSPKDLAQSYCDLAQVYRKRGELDIALDNFLSALTINKNHSLSGTLRITIFRGLAGVYRLKQEFVTALDYLQKALEVSIVENIVEEKGHIYSSLGNIYLDINNNEEAIENYNQSITVFQQNSDTANVCNSMSNKCQAYLRMGELEKADSIYNIALDLSLKEGLKENQESIYRGLGILSKKRKLYQESIDYHYKSLLLAQEMKDDRAVSLAYQNMGTGHGMLGNYTESNDSFEKSKTHAIATKDTFMLRIVYNNLSFLNELMGDYKAAYNYLFDFNEIDKIRIDKIKEGANRASLMKSQIYEKEKELKERELEQVKVRNKYTSVIAALSILLLGTFTYFFLKVRKLNKKLTHTNKQLVSLNQEMHHRVKNNLQAVSSFVYLNYKNTKDTELRNILTSIRSQIVSIGQIHKLLYQGEKDMKIDAVDFFDSLTNEIINLQLDAEKPVRIEKLIRLDKFSINFDKAIQIGLIINELITNAFKYAFTDNPDPLLSIKIETIKNNSLYILIEDNGTGIVNQKEGRQSFGLNLIESLVQQDRWEFSSSTTEGCAYTLLIPLQEIKTS
jgi:two-component sensor histidine kinase/Tfp pilus assembly protein PilF